jgi:CIC family chloride channel protein
MTGCRYDHHQHVGVVNRRIIRPRVPIIKILASAATIGSGGSGGREGPIAQIGAGFGSFLAQRLRLPEHERRILLAAGMGAGIAAIFRAPLAGAIFAIEVLYRDEDFEAEALPRPCPSASRSRLPRRLFPRG